MGCKQVYKYYVDFNTGLAQGTTDFCTSKFAEILNSKHCCYVRKFLNVRHKKNWDAKYC